MKLRKIVKHLDNFAKVQLILNINGIEHIAWTGSMLHLQVAAGSRNNREKFLEECKKDEDIKTIGKVLTAINFLNCQLDTTEDGEAVGISFEINKNNVTIPVLTIYIKEKE